VSPTDGIDRYPPYAALTRTEPDDRRRGCVNSKF
jgi:hypothetical protein